MNPPEVRFLRDDDNVETAPRSQGLVDGQRRRLIDETAAGGACLIVSGRPSSASTSTRASTATTSSLASPTACFSTTLDDPFRDQKWRSAHHHQLATDHDVPGAMRLARLTWIAAVLASLGAISCARRERPAELRRGKRGQPSRDHLFERFDLWKRRRLCRQPVRAQGDGRRNLGDRDRSAAPLGIAAHGAAVGRERDALITASAEFELTIPFQGRRDAARPCPPAPA